MSDAQLTSYEDVPYDSKPLFPSHPDCVATVATLMGMRPAPITRCRVLELGCANGGNLVPMAESLPDAQFLGIDLSPRQIAQGQAVIDSLGLKNLELVPLSILDFDERYGQFDYIICHGVFSWVPPEVQQKILDICATQLTEQGVAYISYNTYPGWYARGMVREMMGIHARRFAEPETRVKQARSFLEFLTRATAERKDAYHEALREECELLRPKADYYLFHEHLEEVNQPLYFRQFAERLADSGLQYVGEAWYHTNPGDFSPDVQKSLQEMAGDRLQLEQYVDFLTNRTFRRSLVCRASVQLAAEPSAEAVSQLYLSGLVRPESGRPDVASTAVEAFVTDDGARASTNFPVVKAALVSLFEAWPQAISFEELWADVGTRLRDPQLANQAPTTGSNGATDENASPAFLRRSLLACYLSGMVALHAAPGRFVRRSGERPEASRLARWQSAGGMEVTNRRHRFVPLGPLDRLLLSWLDGSRDRSALVQQLDAKLAAGDDFLKDEAAFVRQLLAAVPDAAGRERVLGQLVTESLDRLARSAVIVS